MLEFKGSSGFSSDEFYCAELLRQDLNGGGTPLPSHDIS